MNQTFLKKFKRRVRYLRQPRYLKQALHPSYSFEELSSQGYVSQYGQDKWVAEILLPGKRGGVFVDIGAYDGISLSNTFYLEKNLGWTGLALEPMPAAFEKLRRNRTCVAVQGCAGDPIGRRRFRVVPPCAEMLSGLVDDYDDRHHARIKREISKSGAYSEEIEVDCYNINALLSENKFNHIDYLSIDTEGSELQILKSIDFEKIRISVIGVENNYNDPKIRKLLFKKGYLLHSKLACDDFFVCA
jgi:FkbM family methyltransferase